MHAFISRVINVVLPASCPACLVVREETGLCGPCWRKLKHIGPPACIQCGKGFAYAGSGISRCDRCLAFRHNFDRTAAALAYTAMSKKLILGLKYGDRHDVVPVLSKILAGRGRTLLAEADFIVPLPLHPWRYLSRRFNQSAELARAVVRVAGIHSSKYRPDVLIRKKNTESQDYTMWKLVLAVVRAVVWAVVWAVECVTGIGLSKFLPDVLIRKKNAEGQNYNTREARVANMKDAFEVRQKKKKELMGKRVLLVDDVMTTGASLSSAALCLKQAGAKQVDTLVVARVG